MTYSLDLGISMWLSWWGHHHYLLNSLTTWVLELPWESHRTLTLLSPGWSIQAVVCPWRWVWILQLPGFTLSIPQSLTIPIPSFLEEVQNSTIKSFINCKWSTDHPLKIAGSFPKHSHSGLTPKLHPGFFLPCLLLFISDDETNVQSSSGAANEANTTPPAQVSSLHSGVPATFPP